MKKSYTYRATDATCSSASCTVGIPDDDVVGFKNVAGDSGQDLISAESQQPVSFTIEAADTGSSSSCVVGLAHGGAIGLKEVTMDSEQIWMSAFSQQTSFQF